MAPSLSFYEPDNTTVRTAFAFGGALPGVATAEQRVHVWNHKGSTGDTATNVRVFALARLAGSADAFTADERELLTRRAVEVRIPPGTPGIAQTSWRALGKGVAISLPDIPQNTYVPVGVRVNAPAGISRVDVEVSLQVSSQLSAPMGDGFAAQGLAGILSGVRDGEASGVYQIGGTVAPSGPPDNIVNFPSVGWLSLGVPYALPAGTEALDGNDGSASALVAGEAYYAAVTLGAGARTVTKGDKATLPLSDDDKPDPPAGELLWAWVIREFDAIIDTTEIDEVLTAGMWALSTSGLTATIAPAGPGAIVGDRLVTSVTPVDLTMTASSTNYLWVRPDGSHSVTTTSDPPEPRALLVWEVDTGGSGETARRDRRVWLPEPSRMSFVFDETLTGTLNRYAAVEAGPDRYLLPVDGQVSAAVFDNPGSAASSDFDVASAPMAASATYSTLATVAVEFDDADRTATAAPTATLVTAGSLLRCQLTGETTTSQPAGAVVTVLIH